MTRFFDDYLAVKVYGCLELVELGLELYENSS